MPPAGVYLDNGCWIKSKDDAAVPVNKTGTVACIPSMQNSSTPSKPLSIPATVPGDFLHDLQVGCKKPCYMDLILKPCFMESQTTWT